MKTIYRRLREGRGEQGINMVDLMMWLVIAALLLAAAIQGVGYYQKAAYIHQMKSAVDVAASRVVALSTNDGSIDPDDLDTVVAEENTERDSDGISLTVEKVEVTASAPNDTEGMERASLATATVSDSETAYIRAAHDAVGSHDVIYLFEDIASLPAGLHMVPKGGFGSGNDGSGDNTTAPSPEPTDSTSPSPEPTGSSSPEPEPTPTFPEDHNAPNTVIIADNYYDSWWTNKSAQSMVSNVSATFGFTVEGVTAATKDNFKVEFSGGSNIGAQANIPVSFHDYSSANAWRGIVSPVSGGFTEGTGHITVKVTNLTNNEVSYKTWELIVTPHQGMSQDGYYDNHWLDKSVVSMTSDSYVMFGFSINGAVASDFDVKFSGGESINAGAMNAVFTDYNGANSSRSNWYTRVYPAAGGFTEGVGTITATATHKLTGEVFTEDYTLTVTHHPGISISGYYNDWWDDESVAAGSTTAQRFAFAIKGATAGDFDVTFTASGSDVNGTVVSAVYTDYRDSDTWYTVVTPGAGGFTSGTQTITAKAVHTVTGEVFTKVFILTVN